MAKIELFLNMDSRAYSKKPEPTEVRGIQGRMCKPRMISFDEFVSCVCSGYSFRQCAADGMREENFISTQLLAVDIDNKDGEYLTIEEAMARAEKNRLTVNFLYPSFSDTPDHRRFRMVFLLDNPVKKITEFKRIYDYLISIFPGCDTSCRNPAHLFFGTNATPIVVNADRVNSKKSLSHRKIKEQPSPKKKAATNGKQKKETGKARQERNISSTGKNIEAIRIHNIKYLKGKLRHKKIVFNNRDEFFHWLYHDLNMMELLDLPRNFNCIFHDDENASASIFQTNYGTWKYKCFAESCEVNTLNAKEVIEKLGNFKSEYKALDFIKEIYNVTIRESEWSREQKENIDSIMDCFNSKSEDGFINCCPHAYQTTRNATDIFNAILRIAKSAIYPERTATDANIIFYMSMRQLAKEAGKSSLDKVNKYVKMLVYHGMIEILDDSKVPKSFLQKAVANQRNTKNHVQFYSIPSWVIQQKLFIDKQGEHWKENGYRLNGISYECFLRTEGAEVARRLYPQTATYTNQKGEVHQKQTSKKADNNTAKIAACMLAQIERRGYATEKDVKQELGAVMGHVMTDTQIKRSLQEIMDTYGLQKVRANAELKAKYQMELPPRSNPAIIIEG